MSSGIQQAHGASTPTNELRASGDSPSKHSPGAEDKMFEKESGDGAVVSEEPVETAADRKKKNGGLGPVALIFACGTALFSDGYVNANSGPTNTILRRIYGTDVYTSHYSSLYSSMAFAGTLLGMLVFGVLSDRIGRKFGMIFASLWLALFSVLISGAWGAGGSIPGLFAALEAYRFLQGIAIGAEYPAGSVAASENTESKDVNPRRQQLYFVLSTNSMIDLGFVAATLVALILYQIFGDNHLVWVWRLTLGLGAIPPLAVLFFRVKMAEPEHYRKGAIKRHVPWLLVLKKYWLRLTAVCIAWFAYDFVSFPAGIYSSYFLDQILGKNPPLTQTLGWSVLINTFYLPGTFIGAFVCDRLGPKNTMLIGLVCQAIFGYALAGAFGDLKNNIGGLVVLYGLFVAFGEFGSGNNLGLLASKAVAPSAVRGTFYGIAAGIGKVGAFVGTYAYTDIQNSLDPTGKKDIYYSGTFYIGASLAVFAALVVFFFVPPVVQDGMAKMDAEFEEYLRENNYDMSNVGLVDHAQDPATRVESGESKLE